LHKLTFFSCVSEILTLPLNKTGATTVHAGKIQYLSGLTIETTAGYDLI
jgi:hypothetical protein